MVAYFVRRLLGGTFVFVIASFVFHTVLLYGPGGFGEQYLSDTDIFRPKLFKQQIQATVYDYGLDKPWPLSYLNWLFDPEDTVQINDANYIRTKGVDFSVWDIRVKGSGLLTSDFGESFLLAQSTPAPDVYGVHFGTLLVITIEPALLLMLIAALQRIDRRPVRGVSVKDARMRYHVEPMRVLG